MAFIQWMLVAVEEKDEVGVKLCFPLVWTVWGSRLKPPTSQETSLPSSSHFLFVSLFRGHRVPLISS